MAKSGRGQTRRDSKRRVLRSGESVRADGKYQYKYHIDGKPHFVYSWKLEPTDKLPKGKKPCLSLRELEKQVISEIETLPNMADGQMTVCELVDNTSKPRQEYDRVPSKDMLQCRGCLQRSLLARRQFEV